MGCEARGCPVRVPVPFCIHHANEVADRERAARERAEERLSELQRTVRNMRADALKRMPPVMRESMRVRTAPASDQDLQERLTEFRVKAATAKQLMGLRPRGRNAAEIPQELLAERGKLAEQHNIPEEVICGPRQTHALCQIRRTLSLLALERGYSLQVAAKLVGRHHSTVQYLIFGHKAQPC